jgi:hypothetical protein
MVNARVGTRQVKGKQGVLGMSTSNMEKFHKEHAPKETLNKLKRLTKKTRNSLGSLFMNYEKGMMELKKSKSPSPPKPMVKKVENIKPRPGRNPETNEEFHKELFNYMKAHAKHEEKEKERINRELMQKKMNAHRLKNAYESWGVRSESPGSAYSVSPVHSLNEFLVNNNPVVAKKHENTMRVIASRANYKDPLKNKRSKHMAGKMPVVALRKRIGYKFNPKTRKLSFTVGRPMPKLPLMKLSGEDLRRPTIVKQPVIRKFSNPLATKAQRELAKKRAYNRISPSKAGNEEYAEKLIKEELNKIKSNSK